jgi:hypothetical protein
MFADAQQLTIASVERTVDRRLVEMSAGVDRRLADMSANIDRRFADMSNGFERRLTEETSKIRVEMALMKFDIVKWNLLFWVGQLAAMTAILSLMLRGLR